MSITGFSVEQDPEVQAYKRFRTQVLAEERRKKEGAKSRQRVERGLVTGVVEEEGRRNIFSKLFRQVDWFDHALGRKSGSWRKEKKVLDDSSDENQEVDLKDAWTIEVPTKA